MPRLTNTQLKDQNKALDHEIITLRNVISNQKSSLINAHNKVFRLIEELENQKTTDNKLQNIAKLFRKNTSYDSTLKFDMSDSEYLTEYLNTAITTLQTDLHKYKERYSEELHRSTLFKQRAEDLENSLTVINNIALAGNKN